MSECAHSHVNVIAIVSQCVDCKQPFTHRIESTKTQFSRDLEVVHQGLVDRDSIIHSIRYEMTDEQKQLIGYCSIPPSSEFERINFKCGYDCLKPTVADYFK